MTYHFYFCSSRRSLYARLPPGPPCRSRTIHHRPPKAASLFLWLPIRHHPPRSRLASSGSNPLSPHRARRLRYSPVAVFSSKPTKILMASRAPKSLTAPTMPTKPTCPIFLIPANTLTQIRTCTPLARRARGGIPPPCTCDVALTGACCPLQVPNQPQFVTYHVCDSPAQIPLSLRSWRKKPPGVPQEQRRRLLRLLLRSYLGTNRCLWQTWLRVHQQLPPHQYIGRPSGPFSLCLRHRPQHRLRPLGQPPALDLLALVRSPHHLHENMLYVVCH